MTGFAGVVGQPGPGSSVFRVPSVRVENPKDEMIGVALLGQLVAMVTGLAHAVLPYLNDFPLRVVTVNPMRPPVAVCNKSAKENNRMQQGNRKDIRTMLENSGMRAFLARERQLLMAVLDRAV
jgi:hypothetical protein